MYKITKTTGVWTFNIDECNGMHKDTDKIVASWMIVCSSALLILILYSYFYSGVTGVRAGEMKTKP